MPQVDAYVRRSRLAATGTTEIRRFSQAGFMLSRLEPLLLPINLLLFCAGAEYDPTPASVTGGRARFHGVFQGRFTVKLQKSHT